MGIKGSWCSRLVESERLGEGSRGSGGRRVWTLDIARGQRSGVSRAMISKLERGEKNPTLVVAAKVAEGLGVTLTRLVGIEERREVVRDAARAGA